MMFLLEGLAEYCSLSGRDARSQARTQGAPVSSDTGATEDAAWGEQRGLTASRYFAKPS